ncbi:MAG: hypothetical protein RLZZ458_2572 [Planctomycetota bacterium]|jgi:hypothetical protein
MKRVIIQSLVGCQIVLLTITNASTSVAGIVVNWGGDYVSKDELLAGSKPLFTSGSDQYGDPHRNDYYSIPVPPASAVLQGTIAGRIEETVAYNPGAGTTYDPMTPKDSTFYGGHAVVYGTESKFASPGATKLIIENQGPSDAIHAETGPSDDLKRFVMLTYWTTSEFLIGPGPYSLNGNSTFSLSSTQDSNPKDAASHVLRWVVRNGNQFYVSGSATHSTSDSGQLMFANNTTYTSNYNDITSWTEYNPFDGFSSANASSFLDRLFLDRSMGDNILKADINFSNVTALGFYIEYLRPTNRIGAGDVDYKIKGFTADVDPPTGNSVPEPSTFALGLVGLSSAALRRWRKRRGVKTQDAPENSGVEPSPEIAV